MARAHGRGTPLTATSEHHDQFGLATAGSPLRVAVVGVGIVGARAIRQLHASPAHVIAATSRPEDALSRCGLADDADVAVVQRQVTPTVDIAVLAVPAKAQIGLARRYLATGAHVVAVNDDLASTRALLNLDAVARERGRTLVVGSGFAPGLSCALANYAASRFAEVTEIHVAKHGTAGPACARQHHRALRTSSHDVRGNKFLRRPGGSGRELVWFPGPVDGADCYRAELSDPALLRRSFPQIDRATSRVAAHRRDRLTSILPMMMPPHAEGGVGAVRVEARGLSADGVPGAVVVGATARPGDGCGAMVAAVVDRLCAGDAPQGALGVGELGRNAQILAEVKRRGVPLLVFEGSSAR